MSGRRVREEQVEATREAILAAAERLYAEHGVHTVSNRQISIAAGQGNTGAVGYHFGAKEDLLRAIAMRHAEAIEQLRAPMVAEAEGLDDLRPLVACLVCPVTDHLTALGIPSWYARFNAQVAADPALYEILVKVADTSPTLLRVQKRLYETLPHLTPGVKSTRYLMSRHLIVQMCAEAERSLAGKAPAPRRNWEDTASDLIDAVLAVWQAPAPSA